MRQQSHYRVRNFLFGLLRLVADASPVIVLLPSLLYATAADALIVVAACMLVLAAAVLIQVNFRTAFNLRELRRLVETRERVEAYTVADYLAVLDLVTPPPVERFGRRLKPDYRVLVIPGRAGFSAYQYAPERSFILVPFRPHEMTLGRLSGLLHEMGHMGTRNWLTATAYASYKSRVANPTFRDGMRNVMRLLYRLQSMETAMAFAAILLFLHNIGFLYLIVLMVFVNFSGYWRVVGARVEAEVEADQYQWHALWCIHLLRASHPVMGREGDWLKPTFPIVDTFLTEPDNWMRNQTLGLIRSDAARGFVRPSDAYLWEGAFRVATIWAGIRLVLAAVATAVIGVHPLNIEAWLLALYAVICAALTAWSFRSRATAVRRLEAAIFARAVPRQNWQSTMARTDGRAMQETRQRAG